MGSHMCPPCCQKALQTPGDDVPSHLQVSLLNYPNLNKTLQPENLKCSLDFEELGSFDKRVSFVDRSNKGKSLEFWLTNLEDAEIKRLSPCTNLSPRKEEEEEEEEEKEGSRGMGGGWGFNKF
jgi:hypothetical protein